MNPGGYFTKQRYLWQPGAWRILRERSCTEYVRQVVPATVSGIRIHFPETSVRFGPQVTVTTSALRGQSVLTMLYEPGQQDIAVTMGLVALEAWQRAVVAGHPFRLFSLAFRLYMRPSAMSKSLLEPGMVSPQQRKEFKWLVTSYTRADDNHFLVHGDLHASHLIVDLAQQTMGIIDLEATHIGKAATNFAQLWTGYHYAEPELGRQFYRAYKACFPAVVTTSFDSDVAPNSPSGVRNTSLNPDAKAIRIWKAGHAALFTAVLSGSTFEELCLKEPLP